MDLVADLRTKAARERAWLVGDRDWMRRWLLARADATDASEPERKSGFSARCLALAAAHAPGLRRKALPTSFRELDAGNALIPHWLFEPRIPAGNGEESGRWTRLAGDVPAGVPFVLKLRKGGGHHVVARASYKNRGLSAEATKVFENAKTGKLLDPKNNYFDKMHRLYNEAVSDLLDKFLVENNIKPEAMSGEEAHRFVREVISSKDPRIRDFNLRVFRAEIRTILKRRFGGRE